MRAPHLSRTGLLGLLLTAALAAPLAPASSADDLDLATPTLGRSGTGLRLGVLDPIVAPVGDAVDAKVRVSVANIPTRTSRRGFRTSLEAITANRQDFVLLNEVGARDLGRMEDIAKRYRAYRDPVRDLTLGGTQSMNNVVMWRAKRWNLVDAGRVKVVNDDRGYRLGEAFTWDRYLTWAVLQRTTTGDVVSVVSLHMPTNPEYYPKQPKDAKGSRLRRYKRGMDRVLEVVDALAAHGPVLLGGDMNSHPTQGRWTAASKMATLGYTYAKDAGVMYLFHPGGSTVTARRVVDIASDHPALLTTIDLGGAGPS